MKVPFTWKVTGWFMVGWSPEFPVGEVRPLHYFGEDLAAYRDESGELHVLEAHCKHLGAHIGHGHNAKIFSRSSGPGKGRVDVTPGSPGAAVLPELGPEPTDLRLSRWHGVGPMGGTDLDAVLRNLEVSTIVVVGVSLNIAIPNLVMDAVNAADRVIVPRDAVAGVPAEYGTAVIDNTLSLLATITTTDELIGVWT